MSVKHMAAALQLNGLHPTEKLVLLALANHADEDGYCFPGQEYLGRRCGISERQVRTWVKRLENQGLVRRVARGGGTRSARYQVFPNMSVDVVVRPQAGTTDDTPSDGNRKPTSGGNRKPTSTKPEADFRGTVRDTSEEPSEGIADGEPPAEALPAPVDTKSPRDELWDTLVDIFGEPLPSARSLYGKAVKELHEAGATPTDVRLRAARMAATWGKDTVTVASLLKHWGRFGSRLSDPDFQDDLERVKLMEQIVQFVESD